jgi:predicted RNA-binding Zn ribbon-like protein
MNEPVAADTAHPVLPPAPGAERFAALDFADSAATVPGGQSYDLLGTPTSAMHWLAEHGLTAPDIALQDVCAARLRGLREHVRTLLASRVADLPAPRESLDALNRALTRVPTAPLIAWNESRGLYRVQEHPTDQAVDHALAVLAADAADLLAGPDSARLAACGAAPCDRYLLRTHGRRHWCSIRCGDRVRAARAYARRSAPA